MQGWRGNQLSELISCLGLKIGGATAAQHSLWQVIHPLDSNVGKNSPRCYVGDRPGIPSSKEILGGRTNQLELRILIVGWISMDLCSR